MNARDYQKSKVYLWESQFPEGAFIPFDAIPAYVKNVWSAYKLEWPPLVMMLHVGDRSAGKGGRHQVLFPAIGATELTILHELAHSMTATHEGYIDAHGPQFVGVYMRLLCHHLDIPLPLLLYTATQAKIDYNIHAKPWCGS